MAIFLTMLLTGVLLGFIGAGGSGTIIAILTIFFGVPLHIALGTSLSAMVFTSLSGAYSHFRENNVAVRVGLATGLFGAVGAFIGSRIAQWVPSDILAWLTAAMMFLSAVLLWLRLFTKFGQFWASTGAQKNPTGIHFWLAAFGIGLVTGMMSGLFGIGASPFIQIGLLVFFGLSVQQSVGTTLLIVIPTAMLGGFGYYTTGNLDVILLSKVVAGTIIGSYIGAKFTTRVKPMILKTALISVPVASGLILVLGK
jgi:uncharacterized membrane protein YfcA